MAAFDLKSEGDGRALGPTVGRVVGAPISRGRPWRSVRSLGMQLLLILWGVDAPRTAAPRVLIET